MIKTSKELIRAFGGPRKFAEAIDVSLLAARQMSTRNRISPVYFPRIVMMAPQCGLDGITLELLYAIHNRAPSYAKGSRDYRFHEKETNQVAV